MKSKFIIRCLYLIMLSFVFVLHFASMFTITLIVIVSIAIIRLLSFFKESLCNIIDSFLEGKTYEMNEDEFYKAF